MLRRTLTLLKLSNASSYVEVGGVANKALAAFLSSQLKPATYSSRWHKR